MKQKDKQAFTLIETILVLTLMSILALVGGFYLVNYKKRMRLISYADQTAALARLAKAYSMAARDAKRWQICIGKTNTHYYAKLEAEGDPNNRENKTLVFNDEISVEPDNFCVIFEKLSGRPAEIVAFELRNDKDRIEMNINPIGQVNQSLIEKI